MADYPDWTSLAQIVGTDVKVAVDIQGGYIMLPVDIQAQNINVEIDIVAQTVGYVTIDIAAQTLGNLDINIAAQAANIDIDIKASSVTLTVTVSGTAQIDIETQSVGIYLQPDWQALQGNDKNFNARGSGGFGDDSVINYTVPTGKTLYLCGASFRLNPWNAADYDHHTHFLGYVMNYTDTIYLAELGGNGGNSLVFPKPIALVAGKALRAGIVNKANITCGHSVSVWGYEI